MLEFIIANYMIFIVIAIVLLLGLFGYMMDRTKYEKYRQEIANEERVYQSMSNQPNISEPVATSIPTSNSQQNQQ